MVAPDIPECASAGETDMTPTTMDPIGGPNVRAKKGDPVATMSCDGCAQGETTGTRRHGSATKNSRVGGIGHSGNMQGRILT